MNEALALLQDPAFWAEVFARATPLVLGAMGALFCARAGVLNLGIEGIFILGALAGLLVSQSDADPWHGLLVASGVGLLLGLVHGMLTGPLAIAQPLTGLALTLLGVSVAQAIWRADGARAGVFGALELPRLSDLPYLGAALFQQSPLSYLAVLLALLVAYILNRTPLGLAVRGCGENPVAVTVQGRSVHGLRIGADMVGSAMMAAGGAAITLTATTPVAFGEVSGRGFLCLALAGAAGWRPGLAFAGALLFGTMDAASPRLAQEFAPSAPLMLMVPYLLAIFALAASSRRLRWPSTLLAPLRSNHAL